MKNAIIVILSSLLLLSIVAIFFLSNQKSVTISIDSKLAPTPTITPIPSPTNTPTPTPQSVNKKVPENKISIPINSVSNGYEKDVEFTVTEYQITSEVVVKGQIASAVQGRAFLIVDIQIENPLSNTIEINTRDYIRLSINDGNWLAPDIHNDPVAVQAISTKSTRAGFPINTSDTNFRLQLGELNGEKQIINLE